MKIALDTLGCKLNQAETEYMAARLTEAGHTIVASGKEADLYILNTCTVTQTADAKSRQLLRQIHRTNPEALLIATGCYAERSPEDLLAIDGVSAVIDNENKLILPEKLTEAGLLTVDSEPGNETNSLFSPARTRTFIRIQDGCSNFCTYCIVPFVRSRESSVPAEEIIDMINKRAKAGIKEAVLTGTEAGSYSSNGKELTDLLRLILDETDIPRIRLSSLQPDEISEELLALWKNPRMCPHFHLSLQSGSDAVLKRMNRRYTVQNYANSVSLIRSLVPDVAITTDIITGFPGETDDDYQQTLSVCEETGFARIHVFPYSKRPGTAASKMSGQVMDATRTQRNKILVALSAQYAQSYRQFYTGCTMDVLWEQQSNGYWSGYTGNYIRVYAKSKTNLTNRITPVALTSLFRDGMTGFLDE